MRFNIKIVTLFFVICAFCIIINACNWNKLSPSEKRAKSAASAKGDIVIGIVDSSPPETLFLEGVNLAIDEINQKGGVIGRKIRPIIYNDKRLPKRGEAIAKKIARNKNVVAVIGHRTSNVAISSAITYDDNGIVFISPGATDQNLTLKNNNFVFRNIPSTKEVAQSIAFFASKRFKKIAIFYERDDISSRQAEIFNEYAKSNGVSIVASRSFFEKEVDFRPLISEIIKDYEFDAIYIMGTLGDSAEFMKQSRAMGVEVPFIGSVSIDSSELFSLIGRDAEGSIVSTVFNPNIPSKLTRKFVNDFNEIFGIAPDTWAAQGYDAVHLIAHTIETSKSTVPIVMASTLRFLENWKGITGTYSFTTNGDIVNKTIYFKQLRDGKFEFIEDDFDAKSHIDPFFAVEDYTLRLPLAKPVDTIDPGLAYNFSSVEVTEQLFMGLTDLEKDTYNAIPELATKWTVTNNGHVYRFFMRKDVFWTNGKPVTAHDVVWTIQRNLKPETNAPSVYLLYIIKNAYAIHSGRIKDFSQLGIVAIDDYTVEFTLEHSAPYFPALAGLGVYRPLPKEAIEKYKDKWTDPVNIQTNGSYNIAVWKKGFILVLRKNRSYCDADKVAITEVRYHIIPESYLGLVMYQNNELDVMGSSYLNIPDNKSYTIQTDPQLREEYFKEPEFTTYFYGFNIKNPPIDNILVRQAIAYAINRQLLIDLVSKGDEDPALTLIRPSAFGFSDSKKNIGIPFNPIKAIQLLSDAGYPNGENFPDITLVYEKSEKNEKMSKAIQMLLKNYLNIHIRLKDIEASEYIKTLQTSQEYHMFQYNMEADYLDANNVLKDFFYPVNYSNYFHWTNDKFTMLVEQAYIELDYDKRKGLYGEAQRILIENDTVVIPIYFGTVHCLVKPRLKNWHHMGFGGQHIRDWYFSN